MSLTFFGGFNPRLYQRLTIDNRFFPFYWVCDQQMLNNFVSQAATMELHGVPNDLMQNIVPLTIIIFIPICDRLIYPLLRRMRMLPPTKKKKEEKGEEKRETRAKGQSIITSPHHKIDVKLIILISQESHSNPCPALPWASSSPPQQWYMPPSFSISSTTHHHATTPP